ncbi:MAG: hypothetical protein QOF65_2101 [Thermoleophilaceae bacterium]|jgi:hypothetical protein|nr:hypothetical protein [Thermoleophilaceae bacterium]
MWPDNVDEILGGDQVVALAYTTPANGVILTPLTNFGLRDREAGKLNAVNSSVAAWRKLDRIRKSPRIALAYHTRTHGFSDRPEYVLVQGTASLSAPDPHYPKTIQATWERFGGPVDVGRLWNWWLRAYNFRVEIQIAVERVIAWPDRECLGTPEIYGTPVRGEPAEQLPPAKGTAPRIRHRRAARRAAKLPNVLLGWVAADGFPLVVPVAVNGATEEGMVLEAAPGLVPRGGRRAGMLAHSFARYTAGQHQRRHSGWLDAEPGERQVVYAPHTDHGYHMPSSMFVYRLSAGAGTRLWMRRAREAGIAPAVRSGPWTHSSNSAS